MSAAAYAPAAAGAVLVVLALVAHVQDTYWQDTYSIWSHALEVTSDNQIAENGVATGLYMQHK
jgi:hypothetical protein